MEPSVGEYERTRPKKRRHRIVAEGAREMAYFRCLTHPYKAAAQRCDRCSQMFCEACLQESDWGYVCDHCQGEFTRRKELQRHRLRRLLRSRAWIPILAVLGLGAAMAVLVMSLANGNDLRRDLATKMRLLFDGSDPENGVLISAAAIGGRAVAPSGSAEGFDVTNLIDGVNEPDLNGWRSTHTEFPQDVVVQANLRGPMGRVVVLNHPLEPPATQVRHAQILVSDEDPLERPEALELLGAVDLQALPDEIIELPTVVARYLVFRIVSTRGDSTYASIGELEVRGPPLEPGDPGLTLRRDVPEL